MHWHQAPKKEWIIVVFAPDNNSRVGRNAMGHLQAVNVSWPTKGAAGVDAFGAAIPRMGADDDNTVELRDSAQKIRRGIRHLI
jgi:hypothetical protein